MSGLQAKKSDTKAIPTKRVVLNDLNQLPSDYSSTPGGTLFSTTPGGTRIVYDRSFLLHCRNSPLAKTPPANLPDIPGVTSPRDQHQKHHQSPKKHDAPAHSGPKPEKTEKERELENVAEEAQFQMDI